MSEPRNNDEVIIETKGVRVNFGDFWALKGIDVKVRKGEIIVILGPSGSGKSTFIRTLNRLQPHADGTIKVAGIALDEETSAWRILSASDQRSASFSSSSSYSPI